MLFSNNRNRLHGFYFLECLAEMIWESQHSQVNPGESTYLQKLAQLART